MNPHSPYSVRGKLLAFRYAWQGIDYMLRTQANAWIQIGITVVVRSPACCSPLGASSGASSRWRSPACGSPRR